MSYGPQVHKESDTTERLSKQASKQEHAQVAETEHESLFLFSQGRSSHYGSYPQDFI